LADANLTFLQAKIKLETILNNAKEFTDDLSNIENLSLENTKEVESAFAIKLERLTIPAPTFGITLPATDSGSMNSGSANSDNSKTLKTGSAVKQDDALVSIGDFTGLAVSIQVNEIDINDVKQGQPVTISGVAFPGVILHGHVSNISVEAIANLNGGLPTFPVDVIVPQLTEHERQVLHLGMSAQVELIIERPSTIAVPIAAVLQQNGKAMVQLIDPKTGNITLVPVTTGNTMQNSVIIKSGLKAGDKILVNH